MNVATSSEYQVYHLGTQVQVGTKVRAGGLHAAVAVIKRDGSVSPSSSTKQLIVRFPEDVKQLVAPGTVWLVDGPEVGTSYVHDGARRYERTIKATKAIFVKPTGRSLSRWLRRNVKGSHTDRVEAVEAYADLLWFPTGGGKTEAYLGVAAFTMAIRRMQGNLGGFDSSRGLAVIMRYTLRLLTLQQFQRATALICAMEVLRREALEKGDKSLGTEPFTIGLWVGNKVTPGTTEDSHRAIEDVRNPGKYNAGAASPAQLTSCPWCGSEVAPGRDVEVDKGSGRTFVYCGDKKGRCDFSKGKSSNQPHPGIPVLVVDEEIYHRPPTMMIATVDKFAMMAWRGQVRTLFGRVGQECERHGLLWQGADCNGNHQAGKGLPSSKVKNINPIRPPDLIIQDEFHLISGPLGTMVGLYETAVDELCGWTLNGKTVKPKIIASTATVRKAKEQVNNVFMCRVSVFPPHGLDVEDNFFSVQRPIEEKPGRRYLGVCSSDPLCSEHDPEKDRSLHGAACHACALVAETSCERGNRYLDRSLLIPTLERADAAFFKGF